MLLAYASKTGNVKRAINKLLDYKDSLSSDKKTIFSTLPITNGDEVVSNNCILFTYTTGFGDVPIEVTKFIINNKNNIYGVVGSGNKNWGLNYCKACDIIFEKFKLNTLFKFELSGNKYDIANLFNILNNYNSSLTN